jgi:nucleoid-associated protein YgaU
MAAQVLSLKNLGSAPFHDRVQEAVANGLAPLVDSGDLTIDFTGRQFDKATYQLTFEARYSWTPANKSGSWRHPWMLGMTGEVYVDAITRRNYCTDVTRSGTCAPIFKRSPDELGRAIANTALHEIGHLFGLMDATSYKGADGDGHTGDERNPMFVDQLHSDYKPIVQDAARTTLYTIVSGDTLSAIARRIGFWRRLGGWQALYDFAGSDGRKNRERLRSGDPDLIFPGEQIWIPDVEVRRAWFRSVELKPKEFTKAQFDFMRAWVQAGKTIF